MISPRYFQAVVHNDAEAGPPNPRRKIVPEVPPIFAAENSGFWRRNSAASLDGRGFHLSGSLSTSGSFVRVADTFTSL